MTAIIREASAAADYEAFGALIADYVAWCRVRYEAHPAVVDMAFGYQSLDRELGRLPVDYGPPGGLVLLAEVDGSIAGGVAYRRLDAATCEMKRLFVREGFQGLGLGGRLCRDLLARATAAGYTRMRLDTAALFDEAQALYRSLGFASRAPYVEYPPALMPHIVFMERPLGLSFEQASSIGAQGA